MIEPVFPDNKFTIPTTRPFAFTDTSKGLFILSICNKYITCNGNYNKNVNKLTTEFEQLVILMRYKATLLNYFVSARDFERDAQRVCHAERSLKSPLAGTKRCVRLATNNVINTNNCQNLQLLQIRLLAENAHWKVSNIIRCQTPARKKVDH